jgi:hypothetical protein
MFLANLKYQLKNKYPPLAKNVTKGYHFRCHTCPLPLLWHEFDNCLCNFLQSKVLGLSNRNVLSFPEHGSFNYWRLKSNVNSHMSIQYVKQSESLSYHFPICQDTNSVSKESTCADNIEFLYFPFTQLFTHSILFTQPFSLRCHQDTKVTAFVLTRSRQALRFHRAPFRNRAQIVTARVTFSNHFTSKGVMWT